MTPLTTTNAFEKLNERKEQVLNLKKDMGIQTQKAQVVLALDYSASMSKLYQDGTVQELVERVLPLGLGFDDNGEVDAYLFHDSVIRLERNITQSNFRGYVDKYINGRYNMGGTDYAPIINQIVQDCTTVTNVVPGQPKGFISRLLGGNATSTSVTTEVKPLPYPVYVIFITDGETQNRPGVEIAIREASKKGIFFQFIGIGSESFHFLRSLDDLSGRFIDNANFFQANDISIVSDSALYHQMLNEFKDYPKLAQSKGLIK